MNSRPARAGKIDFPAPGPYNGAMKLKPQAVALAVTLLAVGLFNLIAVWGPQALIHDDATLYNLAHQGWYPLNLVRHGLALYAAKEWLVWRMVARQSVELARLLYILAWMMPLAWLLHRLYRKRLGMPAAAALAACALPMLLPAQWMIPAFIVGSYVLPGLLAMAASLYFLAGFTQTPGSGGRQAAAAVLFYLAATQLMDHALFFFPLLLFLLYFPGARRRGRSGLTLALAGVFLFKAAWVLLAPRSATVPAPMPGSRLANTFAAFGEMLPLPEALRQGWVPAAVAFALIAGGAWLAGVFSRATAPLGNNQPGPVRTDPRLAWGAMALWLAGNSLPFLLLARRSASRHMFIAAFGLAALLALALEAIARRLWPRKTALPLATALVIVGLAGAWRWSEAGAVYRGLNARQAMIRSGLQEARLPAGAQVAVYLGPGARIYWGDWRQSTGQLRYMLRRRDVAGCVGPRGRYAVHYDPFQERERGTGLFFRGFSLERPLFLFVERQGKLEPLEHALRWGDWDGPGSWALLQADRETGKIRALHQGRGREALRRALRELEKTGVDPRRIVWHAAMAELASPPGRRSRPGDPAA